MSFPHKFGDEGRCGVLIVHRLTAGAHRYYLGSVGPDPGDAPARGEAGGRWMGGGADALGLSGRVDAAGLRMVLRVPPGRLPGLDLTFAAPKSVSVMHGVGSPDVARVVRRAHDAAVAAALGYLERHACAVRVAGTVVDAEGLVVAAFRHRVSRADDPHLHTHALVANRATLDGVGRALHTPLLYAEQRAAGAVYHAVLRHGLTTDLGVTWEQPVGGRADACEVPAAVRSAFSRRRAAVLAESLTLSDRRWSERTTRAARAPWIDAAGLQADWRARADELGWALSLPARGRVPSWPDLELRPPDADRWTRGDVIVALVGRLPDGSPADGLERLCDRVLAGADVVPLGRAESRHAVVRFSTVAAEDRRAAIAAALAPASPTDDSPAAVDELRRSQAAGGHRLLIVVADGAAVEAMTGRTGATTVRLESAVTAVTDLEAGDVVLLRRPHRLASAPVLALLSAAAARDVEVVTGAAQRQLVGRPSSGDGRLRGPVATVPTTDGTISVAASATDALGAAIDDWLAARAEGRSPVLVALKCELDEINARARAALRQAGGLSHDEVAGFAVGDVVRFTASRPTIGVGRHDQGTVAAIDPAASTVRVELRGGRVVAIGAGQVGGMQHAHAVPLVPPLFAGRDEVLLVGGLQVSPRHLARHRVHRYLTVSLPPTLTDAGPAQAGRGAGAAELRAKEADLRRLSQLPPDGRAHERRAGERRDAAIAWAAQARQQWRAARARGDGMSAAAWDAQERAAWRQIAAAETERAASIGMAEVRRVAEARTAPARRVLRAIEAQRMLHREAAARSRGPGRERSPGQSLGHEIV